MYSLTIDDNVAWIERIMMLDPEYNSDTSDCQEAKKDMDSSKKIDTQLFEGFNSICSDLKSIIVDTKYIHSTFLKTSMMFFNLSSLFHLHVPISCPSA